MHFKLIHTHLSEYGGRAKEWLLGSMASKLATTILQLNHLVSLVVTLKDDCSWGRHLPT